MTLQERLRDWKKLRMSPAPIAHYIAAGQEAADALDAKDARIKELEGVTGYAKRIAIALHAKHYPEVTQWEPFDDLSGILTQIDNMTSRLVRAREDLK